MNRRQGTSNFWRNWWKAAGLATVLLWMSFQGPGSGAQLKEIPKEAVEAAAHEVDRYMDDFMAVLSTVQQNYAEPVNLDKAIYNGAIPGILHKLDPHSNFFDPKSYTALKEEEHGNYFGVGMTIAPRNNRVIVLAPFVGTPAYRAGIRPGDVIVAVNDRRTDDMSAGDVADLLKGDKGTVVRITIARPGTNKPLLFEVTRAEIPRNAVDLKFMVRPGIGYIHLAAFNETTGPGVVQALKELGSLQGLIFDLRGNPGGLINQVLPIAEQFLQAGQLVVSVRGRTYAEQTINVPAVASPAPFPMVVLVNRGTASAAEIVSGALQDHDRALIAGETTFGKGLVQTVVPLEDHTGLALTTARYYTPSGRIIQRSYTGVSLYDYYYDRETENPKTDVKQTEHGRTVYGGGGVTPDVQIPPTKTNVFEDTLLQHYAFFNFAQQYLSGRAVDKNWEVTPAVMNDFRKFLAAQKIAFTEKDLREGSDWIKMMIKTEIFVAQFGQQEGLQVRAQNDPQVLAALKLLPQAAKLLQAKRQESAPGVVASATH